MVDRCLMVKCDDVNAISVMRCEFVWERFSTNTHCSDSRFENISSDCSTTSLLRVWV